MCLGAAEVWRHPIKITTANWNTIKAMCLHVILRLIIWDQEMWWSTRVLQQPMFGKQATVCGVQAVFFNSW